MGNFVSCINTQSSSNSQKNMAKLVDSQGNVRLVDLPITVAELMLENPGFALTPVKELRSSEWIPVMRADDLLCGREVYLLFPVDKVNSRLTDLQLATIDSILCSNNKNVGGRPTRGSGGSKVSPQMMESTGLAGESLEDLSNKCNVLQSQRKRFCNKVWEPVLEPISEGC